MRDSRIRHRNGFAEQVLRQVDIGGITIRETVMRWQSFATMSLAFPDVELIYRISPERVHARWEDCAVGRMAVVPPNMRLGGSGTDVNEDIHLLTCSFNRGVLEQVVDTHIDWAAMSPSALIDFDDSMVMQSMSRLTKEFTLDHGKDLLLQTLGITVAVDLARHLAGRNIRRKSSSQEKIQAVRKMVCSTDDSIPSISAISERLGISNFHLRRLFREQTGQSLQEFIDKERFDRACRLLSETEHPLKVVSFMAGYAQQSAFSFAFKRRLHMTPSAYKARIRSARP